MTGRRVRSVPWAGVEAAVGERDKQAVWKALAAEAMHGGLVPFLGAGVSSRSTQPERPEFRPTVTWLEERIWSVLDDQLRKEVDEEFGALVQASSGSLDRLAEVAGWLKGQVAVVEAVELKLFTELLTSPGHRYVARMAREGWIKEVITTNYDDCLERAYRATFRYARPRPGEGAERPCPSVIVDGEDQRSWGAPRSADGERREHETTLRVYKINGCASRWVRKQQVGSADEAEARLILLADPQLASPNTPWKADLLRDRMRSRTLVYSGFGAEEGQIRYTHLAVEGERAVRRGAAPRVAHGPIVHVFDSLATFPQLQLLAQVAGPGGTPRPDTGRLITGSHDWDCAERDKVCWECEQHKLSSDTFWRVAYRKAMVCAVRAHLESPRSAFRQWLARLGYRHGGPWVFSRMLRWLEQIDRREVDWNPFDEVDDRTCTGSPVLGAGVRVQTLLARARGDLLDPRFGLRETHENTYCEPYRPFQQDAEALCKVLLVVCLGQMSRARPESSVGTRAPPLSVDDALGVVPLWHRGGWYAALLVDSSQAGSRRELDARAVNRDGALAPRRLPTVALDIADEEANPAVQRAREWRGGVVEGSPHVITVDVIVGDGDGVDQRRILSLSVVRLSRILRARATEGSDARGDDSARARGDEVHR